MNKYVSLFAIAAFAAFCFSESGCKKKDEVKTQDNPPADSTFDVVEVNTSFGSMYFWLYDGTPKHKANFLKLAGENYFDSTTFHRIIPNFVIQGGDPNSKDADTTNDGTGGPPYTVDAEIDATKFKHKYGAIGAASTAPKGPSSGSQFYVVVNPSGRHDLNGNYTVFGEVIKGMNVATTIVAQPRNKNDRPLKNIRMSTKLLKKTRKEIKDEYGFSF